MEKAEDHEYKMLVTLTFQDERAKEEVEREDRDSRLCDVRGKQVESFEKQGVGRFASALGRSRKIHH